MIKYYCFVSYAHAYWYMLHWQWNNYKGNIDQWVNKYTDNATQVCEVWEISRYAIQLHENVRNSGCSAVFFCRFQLLCLLNEYVYEISVITEVENKDVAFLFSRDLLFIMSLSYFTVYIFIMQLHGNMLFLCNCFLSSCE